MTKITCPCCHGSGLVSEPEAKKRQTEALAAKAEALGISPTPGIMLAQDDPDSPYVCRADAARLLGVAPDTMRTKAKNFDPPFFPRGRDTWYSLADLADHLMRKSSNVA